MTMLITRKMASGDLSPAQLQQMVAAAVEAEARDKFASPLGIWTPVDKEALPKLPGIEPPASRLVARRGQGRRHAQHAGDAGR